jgi:hypothetical protein
LVLLDGILKTFHSDEEVGERQSGGYVTRVTPTQVLVVQSGLLEFVELEIDGRQPRMGVAELGGVVERILVRFDGLVRLSELLQTEAQGKGSRCVPGRSFQYRAKLLDRRSRQAKFIERAGQPDSAGTVGGFEFESVQEAVTSTSVVTFGQHSDCEIATMLDAIRLALDPRLELLGRIMTVIAKQVTKCGRQFGEKAPAQDLQQIGHRSVARLGGGQCLQCSVRRFVAIVEQQRPPVGAARPADPSLIPIEVAQQVMHVGVVRPGGNGLLQSRGGVGVAIRLMVELAQLDQGTSELRFELDGLFVLADGFLVPS